MKRRKDNSAFEQELKKQEQAFEDKKTRGIPRRLLATPRMRAILWFAAAVLLGGCTAAMAGYGMLKAEGQWPAVLVFFLSTLIAVWNGLQYWKKVIAGPGEEIREHME